jgi:hypothetical protein
VARFDAEIAGVVEVLRAAQAQVQDAAHTLHAYLGRREPDPERLAELDARLSAWVALARRYRRTPAELPALLAGWKAELKALDAAADLEGLERACRAAESAWRAEARRVSLRAPRPRRAVGRGHAGDAAAGHGRRPFRGGAAAAGRAAVLRAGDGGIARGRPRRQHAARRWPRWPRAASCRAWRWPSP